jgi:CheY-like chemotaxis protein
MPDGGRLRIATETTTIATPGPLSGAGNGNRRPSLDAVAIVVSDTGEGMSSDVRARLFEPFFTTKPQGQGTGLGLATVHRIIAKAGGTIAVDSTPGNGTEFRIVLPVEGPTSSAEPSMQLASLARGSGESILIVEDEAALMDLTVRLLERNGYRTLAAATGTEALRLAERHPEVSLLLTDSVMPQMSGQALAARIGALRPGLPVVFMSGYSRGIQGPQPGGDDDLLRKPFTEASLLERVSRALRPDP